MLTIPTTQVGKPKKLFKAPLDGIAESFLYGWSLERLTASYAGACIRVRRDDDTEQDINFLANGSVDIPAIRTFVGASGNAWVRTWYDQGTSGDNLTIGSNAWKIIHNGQLVIGIDGKPTLQCFATGQFTTTLTSAMTLNNMEMWFQGEGRRYLGTNAAVISLATAANHLRWEAGKDDDFFWQVTTTGGTYRPTDVNRIWSVPAIRQLVSTATDVKVLFNMSQIFRLPGASNADTAATLTIGHATEPCPFTLRELILWDGMSAANRKEAYDSLNATWLVGPGDEPNAVAGEEVLAKPTAESVEIAGDRTSNNLWVYGYNSSGSGTSKKRLTYLSKSYDSGPNRTTFGLIDTGDLSATPNRLSVQVGDTIAPSVETHSRGEWLLYNAISEWNTPAAFDITPGTISIELAQWSDQELADIATKNWEPPPADSVLFKESKWYVLDDGAGSGMLGDGTRRALLLRFNSRDNNAGTKGASLYRLNLNRGTGGNWCYQNKAWGRRCMQAAMFWLLIRQEDTAVSNNNRLGYWRGKNVLNAAITYHYCKDVLSPTQKKAIQYVFREFAAVALAHTSDWNLTNMEMETLDAYAYIYASCPENPGLRELCLRNARTTVMGTEAANANAYRMGSDPGWFLGGWQHEGRGFSMDYGGRSFAAQISARNLTYGDASWKWLDEIVRQHMEVRALQYVPHGTGYTAGVGYNSRVGGTDQQGDPDRNTTAAVLFAEGRPLLRSINNDRSALEAAVTSTVNSLSTLNQTEDTVYTGTGWLGPVQSGAGRQDNTAQPWVHLTHYTPDRVDPAWYTNIKSLYTPTRDPSVEYPSVRPSYYYDKRPGDQMWFHKGTDGTRDYGWQVEAINSFANNQWYGGWTSGGRIESFWTSDLGVTIFSARGDSGTGTGEQTGKVNISDLQPNMGFCCGSDANYPIESVGGGEVVLPASVGDVSSLFKSGLSIVTCLTADHGTYIGTITTSGDATYSASQTRIPTADTPLTTHSVCYPWGTGYGRATGTSTIPSHRGESVFSPPVQGTVTSLECRTIDLNRGKWGGVSLNGGTGVSAKTVFTPLAEGLQAVATFESDQGNGQMTPLLDYVIPVLLRKPSLETTSLSISYLDGTDLWRVLPPNLWVTTDRVRLSRSGGTLNGEQYIYFDSPQTIKVSPTYLQTKGGDAETRNILVDLHPTTRGLPVLVPTSTSMSWSIRTTDPGPYSDGLSMEMTYPNTLSFNVPSGEPMYAQFNRFGGTSPTFTLETYDGATWTEHSGSDIDVVTDDSSRYEIIGTDSGLYPSDVEKMRIKGVDGGTIYSNEIDVTVGSLTLWMDDDYTDTPGTKYIDHTPTPLDPGVTRVNTDDAFVTCESEGLVSASGASRQTLGFNHAGLTSLWVQEAKVLHTSGSNFPAPNFRDRPSAPNTRWVIAKVGVNPITFETSNITMSKTTEGGSESLALSTGTWYTIRQWTNKNTTVCQVWNADKTTLLGTIAGYNLEPSSADIAGIGLFLNGVQKCEYHKIWRFN